MSDQHKRRDEVSNPGSPETVTAPLAIVGMSCLFPKCENLDAYWRLLKDGVDAITDIPATHWRVGDYYNDDPKAPDQTYARRGGFLDPIEFDPLQFGIAPNDLEATDSTQLLGLVAAQRALEDAGYGKRGSFDKNRVSVILGVTGTLELVIPLGARLGHPIWRRALAEAGVAADVAETVVNKIADSYVPWQENSFPGLLGNVVAGRIANRLDLGGTNCVVDAACASSLGAIHLAGLELATGRSDMVVTGGMDTFNDIFMYMCFSKTPALSPTGDCRPFDHKGDGTILGEGLGVLVLKRLADARRDGDRVYAVIRGVGSASDGKGTAVYTPVAAGQVHALNEAYRLASVTPDTVELIEAHATGTKVGDATEIEALNQVFRGARSAGPSTELAGRWCALGSVKSQLGHTKAAAGVAGVIKAALALHHKVLPPTLKVERPLAALATETSPFYVNTVKRPWLPREGHPRRAGVSAFGFGGSNFHCVLEESDPEKPADDWDGAVQILAFAAATPAELRDKVAAFPRELGGDALRIRAAACRQEFLCTAEHRVVIAAEQAGLAKALDGAVTMFATASSRERWSTPDGAFYASGAPGKLAMLFPGQGSQYVGMLRDLACQQPAMLRALAKANESLATPLHSGSASRLSDLVFPPPGFDDSTRERGEAALRDTKVAQPAIGAVSLGALDVLARFGLTPDLVGGHSYGELVALHAAGAFDTEALFTLSALRGRLMAEGEGDRGAMLAASATEEALLEMVSAEGLDLVIANHNAPTQTVLSGSSAEIERALSVLAPRGIRATRLPVSAAFHSALVADAAIPFRKELKNIEMSAPAIPVYANTTGAVYPNDVEAMRDLLGHQLARPVRFVTQIEAMWDAGARLFIEVGPGARLTSLVQSILGERQHTAVALDASAGKRSGLLDLARVLAHAAALGLGVKLIEWDDNAVAVAATPARKPAMTVRLSGANYTRPRAKPSSPPAAPLRADPRTAPRAGANPAESNRIPMNDTRMTPATVAPQLSAAVHDPPRPLASTASAALSDALRITQDNVAVLQRMQEQTASLHHQFLASQESLHRTLHALVEQQQRILENSLGWAPAPVVAAATVAPWVPVATAAPAPMPMPVSLQPPGPAAAKKPAPAYDVATVPGKPVRIAPPHAALSPVGGEGSEGKAKPGGALDPKQVESVLLGVVAEKTGYPADILDLDMEMDSDLGIDSIKKVEILSALQERIPAAPVIKPKHLGTLRTLRLVLGYLLTGGDDPPPEGGGPGLRSESVRGDSRATGDSATTARPLAPSPSDLLARSTVGDAIAPLVTGALSAGGSGTTTSPTAASATTLERSVVVMETIAPAAEREVLDLGHGARLWLTDDGDLAGEVANSLRGRGLRVDVIDPSGAERLVPPDDLRALVVLAPRECDAAFLGHAVQLARVVAGVLPSAGGTARAFVTVSRLDGSFGWGALPFTASPLAGGVAGLAKTAAQEWPSVRCKAIDLGPGDSAALATRLSDEILAAGPLEVGLGKTTVAPRLERAPLVANAALPLGRGELVLVSGGARGVTAATTIALAASTHAHFVLLGRSPEPAPEPAWLAGLTGEADLKAAIARNGAASPRAIADRYREIAAAREIRSTLAAIDAAGGTASYRVVDVRDAPAVAAVVAEIAAGFGPVRGVIHGAGVLADQLIIDKTPEQFARVFATKVAGLRALLAAIDPAELRVLALFSSSTARLGRRGQVDYAIANECLNKIAQQWSKLHPHCHVRSLNWGPWDGGMVNSGLAKLFAAEGVGLIPLARGAEALVAELAAPANGAIEVVYIARPAVTTHTEAVATFSGHDLTLAFERELDLARFPFLRSHVIGGRPVLPMAVMLEWLAHGAVHANPGLRFHGFDDLRVLKGVVLGPTANGHSPRLQVFAGKAVERNGLWVAPVELRSTKFDNGATLRHASADLILVGGKLPNGVKPSLDFHTEPYRRGKGEIYRDYLFHGPDLQGLDQVLGLSPEGIIARLHTAPSPSAWIREPLRSAWLADPLILDSSFQLMIVWSREIHGKGSLPTFASRYRQYYGAMPKDGVRVAIKVTSNGGGRAFADMEFVDGSGDLVAKLDGYECVIDESLNAAFAQNRIQD